MMPGKWNLARFLSEDEALIKKAVRPEEYDKIKELIALAGEDDLGGNHSTSKSVGREFKKYGHTCLWVIITPSDITDFVPVATAKDSDLYDTV
jgi:DNA polymerase-3 subunit alpha